MTRMITGDTNSELAGGDFPRTRYSIVLLARSGDADVRRLATNSVVDAYWKPVYKYIRFKWKAPKEDAEDLTQGFFARVIDTSFFTRFDSSRARFRTYLRLCIDGFVANEKKAAGRFKRGGGAEHVALDFESAEGEFRRVEIPEGTDPEQVFRHEWIRGLFEFAVERLESRCSSTGKEICFRLFERYDLDGTASAGKLTYTDLSAEFSLPVTQVTNHLAFARREFRAIVLQRLRELCGSEEEFREDVREILGGGSR
jgi:DNA-directed RNA polymerase specialized sigma24 family protein